MNFIFGLIIGSIFGFLAGILANLVTPKVGYLLTYIRDYFFLDKLYYDVNIKIRTIADVVRLISNTVDVKQSGLGESTYSINFLISCEESQGLANFLRKGGYKINLTFSNKYENPVKFYLIDIHTKLPDNSKPTPTTCIEFGPNDFETPGDRAFSAVIFSPDNEGSFTINFEYSLSNKNHDEIKSIKGSNRVVTIFDSKQTEKIICEKIKEPPST